MTLAIVSPRVVFYSERTGGRPYCRCVPASAATVLRFAGYDVPNTFAQTLYQASGVAGCGMSLNDLKRAITAELTKAPAIFGQLDLIDLWHFLRTPHHPNRDKGTATVLVHMSRLPRHLQHLVGLTWVAENSYPNDMHAITLAGKRPGDMVLWMDPMGQVKKDYAGTWEPWADVRGALDSGSRGVKHMRAVKGSAA